MDNISVLDKNNCTGCRMCEKICPVNAIQMIENKEGFIEPIINEEKCTNCGLCAKKCPQLNNIFIDRLKKIEVYAAKNKKVEEQKESASGGIFSVIANYVLENDGVVYGSAFNEKLEVEHIGIREKKELAKLRGSKYVQSNTKNTYKEVKENLEKGTMVLFSGTPCQVAGLKSFLGKEYKNLVLIDLICHGVPSPKFFLKYIKWLESEYKEKIEKYFFRSKKEGSWGNRKIRLKNGKEKDLKYTKDCYYRAFIEGKLSRECCYQCKYANTNRIGDITIGDYWGIEKEHPEFYDENGVSAIIINTTKGKEVFEKVKIQIDYLDTMIEKVKKENQNLRNPTKRYEKRDTVYENIEEMEFREIIRKNLHFKLTKKDIVKNMIPRKLKKVIKNINKRREK